MNSGFKFLLFCIGFGFLVGWLWVAGFGLFFFLIILGLVSVHTTHNFVGIMLNSSPLEYKCNLSQNVVQIQEILL